jgi:hypothetical protein
MPLMLAPGVYFAVLWFDGRLDRSDLFEEWGPLELLHEVLTALAAVLFFLSWRKGTGAVRVAGGALAMLAVAAFVREVEVKRVSAAIGWDWLIWLSDHGLQEILLVAMTLPILIYLFINRSQFLNLVRLGFRWQAWPLYLSAILVVGGVYLDGRSINGTLMKFWEELLETYSFVFFVVAAWRHLQLVDDPAWNDAKALPT